jgi:glycosyltransferase involved in cell wall biosynthesis
MPRKRILLLTPRWPYPVVGGDRLRIWRLAKAVALDHEVSLLSLCQTEEEMAAPAPTDGIFASIHRIRLPRWRSWMQMMLALPTSTPLQVAYFRSAALRRQVEALAPGHDMVWCHLVRMAPYALTCPGPRWLEMTDAISLTMQRAAAAARPTNPKAWALRLEAARMRAYERTMPKWFDLVTVVSDVDRQASLVPQEGDRARVVVAPNGASRPNVGLPPAGHRPPTVGLIGRMDSLANRDALWFFVREIWPAVHRRVPSSRLEVIGHVVEGDRDRLLATPGVHLAGIVPSLSDTLRACRVGVCPVRIGAGIQNKLLDCMVHGLASVTSPVGLEGLDAQDGVHVLVARTAPQWVDHVVRLLLDDALATAIGSAAQQFTIEHLAWDRMLQPALGAMQELLGRPPPATDASSTAP